MEVHQRPWAAPEDSVPQPGDGQSALRAPAPVGPTGTEASAAPLPPFELRPHTIPEIIDGAFQILRTQPRKVTAIVATIAVPFNLITAFAQRDALANGGALGVFEDAFNESLEGGQTSQFDTFGSSISGIIIGLVLPSFALVLVSAALSKLVAEWLAGRDMSYADVFAYLAKRWTLWPRLWLLVHLAEALGFVLLIVPGIAAMVFFMLAVPAMVTEDLGVVAAMKRSRNIGRGVEARVLGVAVVSGFVVYAIDATLGTLPVLIGGLVGETYGWLVVAFGSLASSMLSYVGTAGMTLMLYYDLRVRREGLDLSLDVSEHFS